VLVVVYTASGDVLMLQRREPPDFWQSVTGSLETGESPQQAARRELFEETGIDEEVVDCRCAAEFAILPAWRRQYAPGTASNREHRFRLELEGAVDIRLDPREHMAYRWLPHAEAAALASSSTNREAILDYVPATAVCKLDD
jgi:dATP pyrophosphohydrolase